MIFGKKSVKDEAKLKKPQAIPEPVQKYIVAEYKLPEYLAALLKAVLRKSPTGENTFDIRVFDESDASARKIDVKDYTTLDEHPELVLYEGLYNEAAKKVELQEKKKVNWDVPLLSEADIMAKIEALSQPGSTIFFYQARGGTHGGPLGMGAAVIELNPGYAEKKGKKFNVYTVDVIDGQPVDKGRRLFDSNKPKDLAKWIKTSLHQRVYSS
jgi:hypothetical protein